MLKAFFATSAVLLFLQPVCFGQVGRTEIARTKIAQSALAYDSIARDNLMPCQFPGVCNPSDCAIYTFTGAGSWENPGNWQYGLMPPELIQGCYEIRIAPVGNTNSVMIFPRAVISGGKIFVEPGKTLIIPGDLIIKNQ